ncbi:MAG: deoxyribose-phosphate aldolase [Planctomycetota bacterium]
MHGPELARLIDHTLLKPDAQRAAYERLCDEATEHVFFSVCVPPSRIEFAKARLDGSSVKIATVIGFPNGYSTARSKRFEAEDALSIGADELDMVIDVGRLKEGDRDAVSHDLRAVVESGGHVKVIIETALLTDDEKRLACELAVDAGAHFVKTSTGFAGGGATPDDVRLMRAVVGPDVGVKASGGIRTFEDAMRMVEAGATRLGCSASVAIVGGAPA